MTCPACHRPMTAQTLEGHLGTSVTIDVCPDCQAFWFDDKESLQLTPGSTLRLFKIIGDRASQTRPAFPAVCTCPRCSMRLTPVHDLQRATRFEYLRCPARHGRLISFFDFLREKNFITPLSPDQVEALKRNVQFVNCSNCGAPMDLARTSTCAHCGSPLSMIDLTQASQLLAQLRESQTGSSGRSSAGREGEGATGHPSTNAGIDPALPLRLVQARRETESSFAWEHDPSWYQDVSSSGLISAGLSALFRKLI